MTEPIEHLGIELANDFDDKVPRVRDVDLGKQLEMARPSDIRATIKGHAEILSAFGFLGRRPQNHGGGRGRPAVEYWLNKEQALYIASKSETEAGRKTLVMLVKAFSAFERMLVQRLPPFLRAEFAPWTKTWKHELMVELCRLRGEIFTGRHPRWCARINATIYECLLGKELYALLKAHNPKPSKGHNHHQLVDEAYRKQFDDKLGEVRTIVASSYSMADAEARLRFSFQREPMQLPLWPAQRALPGLAKSLPGPRRRKLRKPA